VPTIRVRQRRMVGGGSGIGRVMRFVFVRGWYVGFRIMLVESGLPMVNRSLKGMVTVPMS